jgi:hypothetical protein
MSRVLVFGWAGRSAVALATDLTAKGHSSWATNDPHVAAELVRQHRQITCAVVECRRESAEVCRGLLFRRPDLRIVGLCADGCAGCDFGCHRVAGRDVSTVLPVLRDLAG